MNYLIRLSLVLLIVCQTACTFAMMPHLPRKVETEIVKMIITGKNPPDWIEWLRQLPFHQKDWTPVHIRTNKDWTIDLWLPRHIKFLNLKDRIHTIECPPDSFQKYKISHPHTLKNNWDGSITVYGFDGKSFATEKPCLDHVDTAFSRDGKRFIAITNHIVYMYKTKNGHCVRTIKFPDYNLQQIVDIKDHNYAIVLQDTDEIFLYDPIKKNKRKIYESIPFCTTIAFAIKNRYKIVSQAGDVGIISEIDIIDNYKKLFSLTLDQIELIALISTIAPEHMLNLTCDNPRAKRARRAYRALPKSIQMVLERFVILPGEGDDDDCAVS